MPPEKEPQKTFGFGFKKPGSWMTTRKPKPVSQRIIEIKKIQDPKERNRAAFDLWTSLPEGPDRRFVALVFGFTKRE